MIYSNDILNAVIATLAMNENLGDVVAIKEFPRERRDNPLSGTMISVGAESVLIKKSSDKSKLEASDSPMTVKARVTICSPKIHGGDMCYDVFDRVLAALQPLISKYKVVSIESGELKYSSSLRALVLPLTITIDAGNIYES